MRAILTLSHVEVVELSDKSCGEWEGGDKEEICCESGTELEEDELCSGTEVEELIFADIIIG